MTSLVRSKSQFELTPRKLQHVLHLFRAALSGRVECAYTFGSTSTGEFNTNSDIDLILVSRSANQPFVKRALEFRDLYDIYPRLDLLVYTPDELERQLANSDIGFWKSVRESMKRIL